MKHAKTKSATIKRTHLLAIAVAAALASTLAIAQTATQSANAPKPRLDANGDGVIDRAEAAKFPRLAEKFDQLDTNKDGKLDAGERKAFGKGQRKGGKRMGGMHGGGQGMGMMHLDTDGDGRISRAEAQAAASRFAERFDAMDANKDGYLDRSDMQARMAERRAAFFAAADANKDGVLSREEFAAHRNARMAERHKAMQPRAQAAGKAMPTEAERAQRTTAAFDRIDANKDGRISKAEFEAAKPMGGRGMDGQGKGGQGKRQGR
ncbi:hypothetical protein MASR1M8_09110 [Thermomonas brevis]